MNRDPHVLLLAAGKRTLVLIHLPVEDDPSPRSVAGPPEEKTARI
jgi:hypothetical protein